MLHDGEIDLVVIATRHDQHARLTVEALMAGKAVFVEKPLAIDEEELTAITHALSAGTRPFLHVGFNRRFAPLVVEAKAFLPERGPYSMLYRVNAGAVPRNNWCQDPRLGGGRLVGEGCHFIDLLQYFSSAPPVRVHCEAMADAGLYNGDNVFITVTFADGSVGSVIYLACNDRGLPKERFEVSSGGTSVVLDDFRVLELARGGSVSRRKSRMGQDKGHAAQVRAVVDALREGRPAPIPADELLGSTLATLAAKRALEWRTPVDVDVAALKIAARS
jgi:predicted dehydrogenase